jgi:hypothetical protein
MKWRTHLAAAGIALLCAGLGDEASAGPYPEVRAIFTGRGGDGYTSDPQGMLVLPSSIAGLAVVYRELVGPPLSGAEYEAAATVSDGRWESAVEHELEDIPRHWTWDDRWEDRREEVAVPFLSERRGARVYPYRYHTNASGYTGYVCINGDAFRVAIDTLESLVGQFGADSPEVASWVRAQDQVFHNSEAKEPDIPAPAAADEHPLIHAHRAHQIAAAHFYSEQFGAARALFEAIGEDDSSPWRHLGAFLAARCYIRKGTLGAGRGQVDKTAFAEAERRLFLVLADDSLTDVHAAVNRLLPYVQQRLRPAKWTRYHGRRLAGLEGARFNARDLADYAWLRTRDGAQGAATDDPLSEWLGTVTTHGAEKAAAFDVAFGEWEGTGGAHWLLAALSRAQPGDTRVEALLEAADAVASDNAAFAAAQFSRAKLLARDGRLPEARDELASLLADPTRTFTQGQRNALTEWLAAAAPTFDDFVALGARRATRLDSGYYTEPAPDRVLLATDAAAILDGYTPLRMLTRAATGAALPDAVRADVAHAAWTRAVLLGDAGPALQLAPIIGSLTPDLADDMAAYAAETDDARRAFLGVVTMLRNPGFTPQIHAGLYARRLPDYGQHGDNWWAVRRARRDPQGALRQVSGPDGIPVFLAEDDVADADAEAAALIEIGHCANYLCGAATRWVKRHRRDPLAAEALYLAVRATGYVWSNEETGRLSKAAHALLHKRYGDTEWAEKTPYWYD